MIHLLTYGNFGLFDPKIERAYRRRHMERGCKCWRSVEDEGVRCGSEQYVRNGHAWLRQLATDVETLARAKEHAPSRTYLSANPVAANGEQPYERKKPARRSASMSNMGSRAHSAQAGRLAR
jgi:hypothetical protein